MTERELQPRAQVLQAHGLLRYAYIASAEICGDRYHDRDGERPPAGVNCWTCMVRRVQTEPDRVSITAEVSHGRTVTAIVSDRSAEVARLGANEAVTIVVPPSSVTLVVPFREVVRSAAAARRTRSATRKWDFVRQMRRRQGGAVHAA